MFIYIIRNKITNKMYVGKTIMPISKRWANHIYESFHKQSMGYNLYFHRSIRKHGINNFEFYKIYNYTNTTITDTELSDYEKYFISYYRTCVLFENSNGYNLTFGGDGCSGHNSISVDVYTKELEYIRTYDSIEETARELNLQPTNIQAVMKGYCKSAGNLIFCKKGDKPNPFINEQKEKVDIYTINKKFVKTCNSIKKAADYLNSNNTSVCHCCKNISKTCAGYICIYHGDNIQERTLSLKGAKQVNIFDYSTKKLIKTYNSITEASKDLKIGYNTIHKRLNGKITLPYKRKYIITNFTHIK